MIDLPMRYAIVTHVLPSTNHDKYLYYLIKQIIDSLLQHNNNIYEFKHAVKFTITLNRENIDYLCILYVLANVIMKIHHI